MLFHEAVPSAPYFMLALPEKIYLWDLRNHPLAEASAWSEAGPKPDYEADAAPVFEPYLDGGEPSLADLGEESLVLVVASWLTDLLNSDPSELREQIAQPELRALLFDSGLYGAARRGAVATEAALS